jgi:hypothetical protein
MHTNAALEGSLALADGDKGIIKTKAWQAIVRLKDFAVDNNNNNNNNNNNWWILTDSLLHQGRCAPSTQDIGESVASSATCSRSFFAASSV